MKVMLENQRVHNLKRKMQHLEKDIRNRNKEHSSYRSKSQHKSLSKSQVRMAYWNSIKSHIVEELKNGGKGIPKSLSAKNSETYQCSHKPKLTQQMIVALKMKYEQQALVQIAVKAHKQQQQLKAKKKRLNQLDKVRKFTIQNCLKKKFEPTQEMLENAFMNL